MELTHLLLHPGETIRTPSILLLRWSGGDWIDAQNQLRRLLLAHYAPRVNGKVPPCCIGAEGFDFWYNWGHPEAGKHPEWCSEEGQIASAKVAKAIGCDTLWMDAGWFVGDFPGGVGNWIVKPKAFPHGLRPIADVCHAMGLKWLVWWEPERVAQGTRLQREHPEFLLGDVSLNAIPISQSPAACSIWGIRRPMPGCRTCSISKSPILTSIAFGNDFNLTPLSFWRSNDQPDRQGMTEIRYIEGLYSLWDTIRKEHPNVYIDDCASGGRRIDIETLKRGIIQTRSDCDCVPGQSDWDQSQTYGLSLYVADHATLGWDPWMPTP